MEPYRLALFLVAVGVAFVVQRTTFRSALASWTPVQRFASSLAIAGVVYLLASVSRLDRIAAFVVRGGGPDPGLEEWLAFLVVAASLGVAAYLLRPEARDRPGAREH